jgi:cell division transport system permease protein
MSLPRNFFAPSFRQRRLGKLFAVLVGIMVFLATFSMVAEATLSAATLAWSLRSEYHLTIEIPAVEDEAAVPQSEKVKQVINILHVMTGLTHVAQVPNDEVERLLKPWIAEPELLKALPMPALIDAERTPNSILTAEDIRQQIKAAAPDAHVDDHAAWLTDLSRFIHGLVALAALMIVLTSITLAIVVSLLCRAIMAAEHETISLLHIMGADDSDIAHHFGYHACRLSWPPALIGFLFALLSAAGLFYFIYGFINLVAIPLLILIGIGGAILLVPIVAVTLAFVTARISALNTLYALP